MAHKPPEMLGKHGLKLWKAILNGAKAAPHDLVLLETACKLADRIEQCRQTVAKDGLTSRGRYGQLVAHPLLEVEGRAMTEFRACLKLLGLADKIPQGRIEYR
jgi:P27 family predicted phage terminase small subunit